MLRRRGERRASRELPLSVLIGVLLILLCAGSSSKILAISPGDFCCGGGGGGGGTGPAHATVYASVFDNGCTISINGTHVANWISISLPVGWSIPVSISACGTMDGFSYSFQYWQTDVGSLASPTSASTTLTVSSSGDGFLEAVLNETTEPVGGFNWAGYVFQTHLDNVTGVSGTFAVPSADYVYNGCSSLDGSAIWVGIGGFGNGALWQAGVDFGFVVNAQFPSGAWVYQPWYEYSPTTVAAHYGPEIPLSSPGPESVSIAVSSSSGTSGYNVTVYNATSHFSWTGGVAYTPNGTSAEWVNENVSKFSYCSPYMVPSILPDTAPREISAMSIEGSETYTDYASVYGLPLTMVHVVDDSSGEGSGVPTQYLYPGEVNDVNTDFSLTYYGIE